MNSPLSNLTPDDEQCMNMINMINNGNDSCNRCNYCNLHSNVDQAQSVNIISFSPESQMTSTPPDHKTRVSGQCVSVEGSQPDSEHPSEIPQIDGNVSLFSDSCSSVSSEELCDMQQLDGNVSSAGEE